MWWLASRNQNIEQGFETKKKFRILYSIWTERKRTMERYATKEYFYLFFFFFVENEHDIGGFCPRQ